MATEITVPLVFWGGEPIRTLAAASEFLPEDRRLLEQWAAFISNPATADPPWLNYQSTGRTWLDVSSSDGRRRLFLKPLYVPGNGERPLWYFAGFASTVQDPAPWAGLLAALARTTRSEIEAAGGYLRIEIRPVAPSTGSLLGKVFSGDYEAAMAHLCGAVAANTSVPFSQVQLASHPPAENPSFTTLVLADDFCYRGIRIIDGHTIRGEERVASQPSSKLIQQGDTDIRVKAHRTPWIVSGLLLLTLLSMIWSQSRLHRELNESRREFDREKAFRANAEESARRAIQAREDTISSLNVQLAKSEERIKQLERKTDTR